ncbi:long-chain-fatty-acid--protein ligase [Sinomicrobium sp.]
MNSEAIFGISGKSDFERLALEVYRYQYRSSEVYGRFCKLLGRNPEKVHSLNEIPFLPISFFKDQRVVTSDREPQEIFTSSGTTGAATSKHYVTDIALYEKSFSEAFKRFYGDIADYTVLALLPSYLERQGSSLIYMAEALIRQSKKKDSGFYLHELDTLADKLVQLDRAGERVLLIGVSFALLDLVENRHFDLQNTVVMETGGMKGRRKELVREELHRILREGFGTDSIHSEYGMTELLSQAYSYGEGIFQCPPWMGVLTRDPEDALSIQEYGKTGGINIIDLANLNSCSFIATQDLGKLNADGSFEVLGRFDHADIRGCNLMVM